jgi:hypothetical protein
LDFFRAWKSTADWTGPAIVAYLPNVVVAVLIFVPAGAIAAAVSGLVSPTFGDTPTGKIASAAAPILIMGIATFMILDQLNIAPAIVEITYIALLGTVALGMALAFGLGGREVAARLLEDAYRQGRMRRDEVRRHRTANGPTVNRPPSTRA